MKYQLLLALPLIASCTSLSTKKQATDEYYRSKIIGTWAEGLDENKVIKIHTAYLSDGRFHSYGYLPPEFKDYWYGDGTWEVTNGQSCITVNFDSLNLFVPGHRFCDGIVKLNDKVFIFRMDDKDIKMLRINDGSL